MPDQNETQPIPVSLTDLYQMIGEREVMRHMQHKRILELMEENTQLRAAQAGPVSAFQWPPAARVPDPHAGAIPDAEVREG